MRQSNRTLFGLVTASVLSIGAVTGALAAGTQSAAAGYPGMDSGIYPGMMGGRGGMMGMGPGGMMGGSLSDTTARLTEIKAELGITPAQQDAWKAYAQAVTNQSALMNAHRQTMWSGPMPPPIDQRAAMHQEGTETMQQTAQAAQSLYQVLTPEQKARADDLLLFQPGRGMAWFGRR
jgi:hypothetical protein